MNNRRTHESPMDFEWGNSQGPVDVTSPFHKISQQNGIRRGFDSPTKPNHIPQALQSNPFSSSSAPTAAPFRNPSFTTPRKPFDADLFSEASGAESSPADNADAEDTPEIPRRTKPMAAFTSGKSEKKPVFGKYGLDFQGHSPGRSELRRVKYVDVVQKARKRKRLERDYALTERRSSYDSESDAADVRPRHVSQGSHQNHQNYSQPRRNPGWFANFIDGLVLRPHLPVVLSYYVQFGINAFLAGLFMLMIYGIYSTIVSDINMAADRAIQLVNAEIIQCRHEYAENHCERGMRVPKMEEACQILEACMDKDPTQVGRTTVSARMLADIFSSFAEGMSFKAIVFFMLILAVGLIANNTMFNSFRANATVQNPQYNHPPPTPSHPAQQYHWDVNPVQVPLPPTPHHKSDHYEDYDMGEPYKSIMPNPDQLVHRSPRKGSRH